MAVMQTNNNNKARVTGPGTTSYKTHGGPDTDKQRRALLAAMSAGNGSDSGSGLGIVVDLTKAMDEPEPIEDEYEEIEVTPLPRKKASVAEPTRKRKRRPVTTDDLADVLSAFKEVLGSQKKRKKTRREVPQEVSPTFINREPEKVVAAPVDAMFTQSQAVEAIKQGFSGLGIPGLGPEPNKPKFRVQFDLGPAGKQEAWYHWVSEHDGGLFLVYDTRFEYGMRYVPPSLGMRTPIKVRLPDHNKEYVVYSMDFTHPFGVFFITNLIVANDGVEETAPAPRIGPPTLADFGVGDDDEAWGN
jgi:hypothetical protein